MPATLHIVTPGKLPLGSVARAAFGIRKSPLYEVIVADSFDYLRNVAASTEKAEVLGLLCKAAISAMIKITDGQHVCCMSELLLPCTSCDLIWPVTFDVSRLSTLEQTSTVFEKSIKHLTSSETLMPCIAAALAKTHRLYPKVCITEYPNMDAFFNSPTKPCLLPTGQLFYTARGKISAQAAKPLPYLRGAPKTEVDKDHSTIYCTDTPAEIGKKVAKAYCQPTEVENNPLLAYLECVVFPYSRLVTAKPVSIDGVVYRDIEEVRRAFRDDRITPQDLKKVMTEELSSIVLQIQTSSRFVEAYARLEKILEEEKRATVSKKAGK